MPDDGVVIAGGANGVGFVDEGEFMDCGYEVGVKDCTAAGSVLTLTSSKWESISHKV